MPKYMVPLIKGVFIPEGMVKTRLERMAYDIIHTYQGCSFTLVTLLKGSSRIFEELMALLRNYSEMGIYNFDLKYEFVKAKSYVDMKSGKLTISGLSQEIVCNKNILVVEDIVDTGNTLHTFISKVFDFGARDVKIFSLCDKPCNRVKKATFKVDFCGFIVPNHFIIGYGLDYNEAFRGLKHIVVLNEAGIKYGDKENLDKQLLKENIKPKNPTTVEKVVQQYAQYW